MSNSTKRPKAEVINPGLGEIDKVRDILFGKYVSDFEHRFAELEARLEKDVEQLKDRLSTKISGMDSAVNDSLARLDKLFSQEQKQRDSEMASLHKTLDEARNTLQHSIALMEDQANQDLKAVRDALKESHEELLDQARAAQDAITKQLEEQREELQSDKVSRQTLALMLDEVAVKLRSS